LLTKIDDASDQFRWTEVKVEIQIETVKEGHMYIKQGA
jgi:hypothetical protein